MPRSKNQQSLRPISTPEPQRDPIAAITVESDSGFFKSAIISREHDRYTTRVDSLEQMTTYMQAHRNRAVKFYAHNGEDSDFTYMLPEFMRLIKEPGVTVKPLARNQGANVISWITNDKEQHRTYQLRDSYAVLPSTLAEIRNTFSPGKPLDVITLRDSLIKFNDELLANFDVNMQWSAAGTALRAWRRTINTAYARQRPEVEAYCRNAYYGGMTYLRTTALQHDVTGLDVSGMYAWSLLQGVPVGPGAYTKRYIPTRPGIYHVYVNCPKDVPMTMIPFRTEAGIIYWATGRFETWITSMEIEAARRRGYEIRIIDGYTFRGIGYPFASFVTKCQRLEIANKGKPLGITTKLMRNALPGRFGLRTTREDYILSERRPEGYTPCMVSATGEVLEGLFYREQVVDKAEQMPVWASWITASARLKFADLHEALGYQPVYYGDTDSIYAPTDLIDEAIADGRLKIGNNYGELKREHDFRIFHPIAPKQYYGVTTDGELINRAKSIPASVLTQEDLRAVAAGMQVEVSYTRKNQPMNILKNKAPVTEPATRTISNIHSSTGWMLDGDRVTPIHLEE